VLVSTRIALEVLGDSLHAVGLALEVELVAQEILDLVVIPVEPLNGHEPLDDAEDAPNGDEIEAHDAVDVVVLHLHRHDHAVAGHGAVHLPEAGARDGLLVALGVALRHLAPEVRLDAQGDLGVGARRHLVLQPLELAPKLLGQEVGEDREELADLDEEPLQHQDGALDALGVPLVHVGEVALLVALAPQPRLEGEPQVARDHAEGGPVRANEAVAARADLAVLALRGAGGRGLREHRTPSQRGS
jgi:hypothetical protein